MRICNISFDDYANFAHENANALRSVGVDCLDFKRVKHPFSYTSESEKVSISRIQKEILEADIIQLFHSDSTFLNFCVENNKRVVVYHTGTTYRLNPILCNRIFNDKVERCFTDQCEFIGLGMKNETYIATAVNTDSIVPNAETPINLFAHYPSNSAVKGTEEIKRMLFEELNKNIVSQDISKIVGLYDIDTCKVDHKNQLIRMSNCDCYIELFNLSQSGKQYGCFGVTAFEAAALGCIVITNNVRQDVYKNTYGDCGLIIVNTEEDFKEAIRDVLHITPVEILKKRERSRNWVEKNHSYKATGEYLKKCLNL